MKSILGQRTTNAKALSFFNFRLDQCLTDNNSPLRDCAVWELDLSLIHQECMG